jgi:hypothetical protein
MGHGSTSPHLTLPYKSYGPSTFHHAGSSSYPLHLRSNVTSLNIISSVTHYMNPSCWANCKPSCSVTNTKCKPIIICQYLYVRFWTMHIHDVAIVIIWLPYYRVLSTLFPWLIYPKTVWLLVLCITPISMGVFPLVLFPMFNQASITELLQSTLYKC